MRRLAIVFAACVLAFCVFYARVAPATAGTSAVRIRMEDDNLWLSAAKVTVADVLTAVAEQTGIRFVVDSEVPAGPITVEVEGMPLERAIRALIAAIPEVAGHTMTYASGPRGPGRLVQVTLWGPGRSLAGGASTVYAAEAQSANDAAPVSPDAEGGEEGGTESSPQSDTTEKVVTLGREAEQLHVPAPAGSYRPEDLSPTSREQLSALLDRGLPMERAVQMLLLQERYQQTLKDLSKTGGAANPPPEASPQ